MSFSLSRPTQQHMLTYGQAMWLSRSILNSQLMSLSETSERLSALRQALGTWYDEPELSAQSTQSLKSLHLQTQFLRASEWTIVQTDADFSILLGECCGKVSQTAAVGLTWLRLASPQQACSPAPPTWTSMLGQCKLLIATDVLYCAADLHAALRCISALLQQSPADTACVLGYEQRSSNKCIMRMLEAYRMDAHAVYLSDCSAAEVDRQWALLQKAGVAAHSSSVADVCIVNLRLKVS